MGLPEGLNSPEMKKDGLQDAFEWLRDNDPSLNTVSDDMFENFSNLSGVPMPKSKSRKDKQQFINDSLEWLRSNDPTVDKSLNDPVLDEFVALPDAAILEKRPPRNPRKEVMEEALEWLRNNDPDLSNVDDPTAAAFSRLTDLPLPKKMSPKNKKKLMEHALDWLRENDPELEEHLDDPTVEAVSKLAGQP